MSTVTPTDEELVSAPKQLRATAASYAPKVGNTQMWKSEMRFIKIHQLLVQNTLKIDVFLQTNLKTNYN